MSLTNFTNLDFDQIKQTIKDYFRSNSDFTDYDFEGSNLSVLIDILAYNTYISSYNANMISNEVFIDSATLRENVVALARNIGYVPRSRSAAKAKVSFFVDVSSRNALSVTLKKGVVATSNVFASNNYIFSIVSDITVPVVNGIAIFENVEILEGDYVTTNFIVSSTNKNQRYILENPNIDSSSIRVLVRSNQTSTVATSYFRASNILNVDSQSKAFYIQEIEDQQYELIFGDGYFGKKLEDKNFIEASYIITNGESGNGFGTFKFSGRLIDDRGEVISTGVSLLTTNEPSQGGSEIESVSSIKNFAPKFYSSQNRAVTAADYEAIIPQIYPEAESVTSFGGESLNPPQFGKVFVGIKPFYGNFVPDAIKQNIKTSLSKYSVAGIIPEIIDIKYLYIEPESQVYYDSNKAVSSDAVKTLIENNVRTYSKSTEINKYGSRFKYSKYQKIIDDSHEAVTSNITKVRMRRDLKVGIGRNAEYEICFGNRIHIKDLSGFNIKSTGFKSSLYNDYVYLSDIPNDSREGRMILFNLYSDMDYNIINDDIGYIDYIKGEIMLYPINIQESLKISGGVPILQISAIPESNDIIGLQDLYLKIDNDKVDISMIPDIIESGSDSSGSLFIPSSSYQNGKLVIN
jgi:hypothetical protein